MSILENSIITKINLMPLYKNLSFKDIIMFTTFNEVVEVVKKGYDIEWSISTYLKSN